MRTITQELEISEADKKELQENVFVRNNDCVRVVLLIKICSENWQFLKVSLQEITGRKQQ